MADLLQVERDTFTVVHGEPQLVAGQRFHHVRISDQAWSELKPAVAECVRVRAMHHDAIVIRTTTFF